MRTNTAGHSIVQATLKNNSSDKFINRGTDSFVVLLDNNGNPVFAYKARLYRLDDPSVWIKPNETTEVLFYTDKGSLGSDLDFIPNGVSTIEVSLQVQLNPRAENTHQAIW